MNNRVLKTIRKTKLTYFISNETNQVGTTFGEKITHYIQEIFTKGYQNVIVVGNDCIEIKAKHLLNAASKSFCNFIIIITD